MDSQTRDLGIESTLEYGARVGAWRVLDLFDAYNVKATIYARACGRAQSGHGAGLHGAGTSQRRMAICGATTSGCLRTRSGR